MERIWFLILYVKFMLFFFLVTKKAGYNFSTFKILSETVQLEHTSDNMIDVKQQSTTTGNASFSTYLQLSSHRSQHFKLMRQKQKKN